MGEQRGLLRGGYPCSKKKIMSPPPQKWLLTPYLDFQLFKLATFFFFLEKKIKKKICKKKFSAADAGTSFGPKKLKSAIKKFSPAPPQPPPKKIFYDLPLAKFFMTPL